MNIYVCVGGYFEALCSPGRLVESQLWCRRRWWLKRQGVTLIYTHECRKGENIITCTILADWRHFNLQRHTKTNLKKCLNHKMTLSLWLKRKKDQSASSGPSELEIEESPTCTRSFLSKNIQQNNVSSHSSGPYWSTHGFRDQVNQ